MRIENYRNLQLLHELSENPDVTQRGLGRRVGLALGLINAHLHRLSTHGLIQILDGDKRRIRYQITPAGAMERNRLVGEYLEYSFQFYRDLRRFLRERLLQLAGQEVQRILLVGTGDLAEVAYLTLQEVGLALAGVVGEAGEQRQTFFNLPVREISSAGSLEFDCAIIAAGKSEGKLVKELAGLGIPEKRMLLLPHDPPSFTGLGLKDWFARSPSGGKPQASSATDVVILCGGRGTRLGALTAEMPKPLLPVGEEPFLLRLIDRLKREGFARFVLAVHYRADRFEQLLEERPAELAGVELAVEPEPLGTGGALRHAVEHVVSPTFVVLNGDTWVQQPLTPVLEEHGLSGRQFTVVAVHSSRVEGEPLKKGVWRIGPRGEVLGFETQDSVSDGWVNAGCYVLDRAMVAAWPVGSYSLEANLQALLKGRESGVFCSEGRMLDIGMPSTYGQAEAVLEAIS